MTEARKKLTGANNSLSLTLYTSIQRSVLCLYSIYRVVRWCLFVRAPGNKLIFRMILPFTLPVPAIHPIKGSPEGKLCVPHSRIRSRTRTTALWKPELNEPNRTSTRRPAHLFYIIKIIYLSFLLLQYFGYLAKKYYLNEQYLPFDKNHNGEAFIMW